MAKLRIGIIGCGGIANGKHMPALKTQSEKVEMVAFCDILIDRAERAVKEYGTADAKAYKDYKEMLTSEKLDAVHVCTPNRSHSDITVFALEAGCHVMCEKPMAINTKEAQRMLDASIKTGKKLTVGYQNRYRPDTLYLKKECADGTLGEVYYAKAHAIRRRAVPTWGVFLNEYEQGGGPLIDIGTHALDLTLFMMDNYKPKYCVGSVYKKLGKQKETGNAWGDWDQEQFTVEDSAFGFVVMENGATVVVESSWALNSLDVDEAKTTLCGTLAGADMKDGLRINGIRKGKQYILKPDLNSGGVAFYASSSSRDMDVEAAMWVDSIINNTELYVKPEQAFVVTQILEGIYESSKTGEPYYFNK